MKKTFLAFLLCAVFLFCSCTANQTEGTESTDGMKKLSSIDRTLTAVNLAEEKPYTCSAASSSEYPDNGKKLTDGKLASSFDREKWVGYLKEKELELVVDLGTVEQGIADLSVSFLASGSYGIGLPSKVAVAVSDNGTDFTHLGTGYAATEAADGVFAIGLKRKDPVSARYVRFTIGSSSSAWLFAGECNVLRYEQTEDRSYYGNQTLPSVGEPSFWEEALQNSEKVNLIAGKTPIVTYREELTEDLETEYYNSIAALPLLTDGAYASGTDYTDAAYVHFTRGLERSLLFDLGYTSAVSGAQICFLQDSGPGISIPAAYSFAVSQDGVGWQTVYSEKGPASDNDPGRYQKNADFDGVYAARFVRLTFSIGVHVYCDEVQVYGTTAVPDAALTPVPDEEKPEEVRGYIMPEDFGGVHNVMLSYHCLEENKQHTEDGLITKEEYLPYVGYYDKTGALQDTFFDGFLFLPYAKYSRNELVWSLEGWKFYLDDIYAPERNMEALNEAVTEVANQLSRPDYRCTVFTSILYPWKTLPDKSTPNPFGDVDGDGVNDSFSSLENRKKAVRWMMQEEYDRFLAGSFGHLQFGGFYWFEEDIAAGNAEEKELIQYASSVAHEMGFKLIWIPYYTASGYDRWEELGFDVACMQPNYMFSSTADASVLKRNAEKTERLGMCVEMEMNSMSNDEDIARYMRYLQAGVEYGYMNAVKMYYQNGVPGAFYDAYHATDPYKHSLYDLTYLYAKERLTIDTPAYTLQSETVTVKDGKRVTAKLLSSSAAACRIQLAVSPEHGDLRLNSNGSFTYYVREGFTGTDYFSVYLDFGYAQSEEIIVRVDVPSEQ